MGTDSKSFELSLIKSKWVILETGKQMPVFCWERVWKSESRKLRLVTRMNNTDETTDRNDLKRKGVF